MQKNAFKEFNSFWKGFSLEEKQIYLYFLEEQKLLDKNKRKRKSGKKGQQNGNKFEHFIFKSIKNNNDNINLKLASFLNTDKLTAFKKGGVVASVHKNFKTPSKADIFVKDHNNNITGISIKNNHNSIQLQRISLNNLISFFNVKNIKLDDLTIVALKKWLGVEGYSPEQILSKNMQGEQLKSALSKFEQNARNRYLLKELNDLEQAAFCSFFEKNIHLLLEMAFSTGTCLNSEDFAQVSLIRFNQEIKLFSNQELIEKNVNKGVTFTNGSVKLGNVYLQKRGGKEKGHADLQFKYSY